MKKVKIYIDACCHIPQAHKKGRAGKGKAACGILIIDDCNNEYSHSKYLGDMTVPEAEFHGLIFALDKATEYTRWHIEIWMDSELVIKWMKKEYRLKKDHIKPLYDKATAYAERYKLVEYFHHGRNALLAKKVDKIAQSEYEKHHKS